VRERATCSNTVHALLQVVMASSNVAGLQEKGYEVSGAAQWNDTDLLPRSAAKRQRIQATTGPLAIRWRIIMSIFMDHCDALLGEPGLMDRMQVRSQTPRTRCCVRPARLRQPACPVHKQAVQDALLQCSQAPALRPKGPPPCSRALPGTKCPAGAARQAFGADVMLSDMFFQSCNAPLSARLGLPVVSLLSAAPIVPLVNAWWTGSGRRVWLPAPLAYVPQSGLGYAHPMARPRARALRRLAGRSRCLPPQHAVPKHRHPRVRRGRRGSIHGGCSSRWSR
jgi:hypothetical protein